MAATTSTPSLFGPTSAESSRVRTTSGATTVPSSIVQSLASLASVAGGTSSGAVNGSTAATSDGVAQPIVRTQVPIFSCTPASYNVRLPAARASLNAQITGGQSPYTVFIIRSGGESLLAAKPAHLADVNATLLKTLPDQFAPGTGSWGVDIAPGTSITFVAKDTRNATGCTLPTRRPR